MYDSLHPLHPFIHANSEAASEPFVTLRYVICLWLPPLKRSKPHVLLSVIVKSALTFWIVTVLQKIQF